MYVLSYTFQSHPSRGAWIEINKALAAVVAVVSHPSRGAWIEIAGAYGAASAGEVAPLTGCVD